MKRVTYSNFDVIAKRIDRLERSHNERITRQLWDSFPELPRSGEAWHLGHNWINCNPKRAKDARLFNFLRSQLWPKHFGELQSKLWYKALERTR